MFTAAVDDGDAAIRSAVLHHDAEIARWLDGPPQTNAIGRSALFVAALLTLAQRFSYPFELLEIGSSAGLNLLLNRYRYELGERRVGPASSDVVIAPVWHGASPPAADLRIASVAGCDVAPLDVRNEAEAERLLSYVWVDQHERLRQTAIAIDLLRADPPKLVQADAADFVEDCFASPQPVRTTRVLMHSIVWQYLPDATKARVTRAVERAGGTATLERPIACVAFEVERGVGLPVLTLRTWPGDGKPVELATAHPHGAHVEWLG